MIASHDPHATDEDLTTRGSADRLTRRPLPIGSLVAERYRVERFVDEGGMAQVFEATNLELDERVALKLAHPGHRSTPALVARFRAEARVLARIRSEHVARVFDVIATDTGDPVMVMEFLEGEDLARLIEKNALPSRETLIGWMIEVCSGLGVAHANGIVHRDVKPGNLFIARVLGGRRTVKVLDFGISRLALTSTRETREATRASVLDILGTPGYMAPEQILSVNASDPRIDVWSIGVVLFELLTGELPFTGGTMEALCAQILEGPAPDLAARCPDVDPELAAVVERCLQRDAGRRFPSVADLAVALLPFAPAYHVSSVDQTVSVLKAAGLTTVDVPAVISLRPSNRGGSFADTMVSMPVAPPASSPPSLSLPVLIAAEAPAAKPPRSDRSRWLAVLAIAVGIALGSSFRRFSPPSTPAAMVDVTPQSTGQNASFPLAPPAARPTTSAAPTARAVDVRPSAPVSRPGRTGHLPVVTAAAPTAPATPTVKIIDDNPSTTRVIQ